MGPAPAQSRRTLEIVHNFGRALGHGPHLHMYKSFAAMMGDARDDEVAGNAAPRDGTVHSSRMENVFVNFDAFAANIGGCFVNFVGNLTLYDTRCNAKVAMRTLCSIRTTEHAFLFRK